MDLTLTDLMFPPTLWHVCCFSDNKTERDAVMVAAFRTQEVKADSNLAVCPPSWCSSQTAHSLESKDGEEDEERSGS